MNSPSGRIQRVLSMLLMVALICLSLPLGAASAAPATPPSTIKGRALDLATQRQLVRGAEQIAAALVIQADGRVALNSNAVARLDPSYRPFVTRLVADLNAKRIGVAVVQPDGNYTLYGNAKALDGMANKQPKGEQYIDNSVWTDWSGVHIYVDLWWTSQLRSGVNAAVTTFIGFVQKSVCKTNVICFGVTFIANIVWRGIYPLLTQYGPESFTIHMPWWGSVHVQLWRSGAWYNGRYFMLPFWT